MNINKTYMTLSFYMALIFLSSCATSYKTVYIENTVPAEAMLPNDISSLTLMNRSLTNDFNNYPADSLQAYFYKKSFDVNAAILDSSAADTCLMVLGELLFESGRYDVVIPEDRNIYKKKAYYKIDSLLEWSYVREICDLYNTDALLVLERYINKITTSYDKISGYDLHFASIDSKYDAIVRIYDPAKEDVLVQLIISDTIFWAEEEYSQMKLFSHKLVPVKTALIETGIQVALEINSKLAPQWKTEVRGYFSIKDEKADQLKSAIANNNWQAAFDYWEYLLSEKNSISTQSKLEYNLAVAHEMLGNINEAAKWASKSYTTQYHRQTETYLYQLKKRKKILDQFKNH